MLTSNIQTAAPAIRAALDRAHTVLILSHINPDGDAIGSMLAAYHALQRLGKQPIALASSALPGYSLFLPGIADVQIYQPGTALPQADLTLMLDTATLARCGAIYDDHAATLAKQPLVVVDHHVTNDGGDGIFLVNPQAASTCELLYLLLAELGIPVDATIGTCLLLGISTDTQSFQTSATTAQSLRVTAELLERGADLPRVTHEVYYALPPTSALLVGQAIAALQVQDGIAWTTVTTTMMDATGAEDEAGDEVVRLMQRVAGIAALVLFKERRDGSTKLSLRSRPPVNVATFAQRWGGGGHAQAAGATLDMSPGAAAAEVLPLLRRLVDTTVPAPAHA